jgi:hypothetical protein
LVVSGLEAGKFLTVQLPSIWIWEGAGTTLPSITPKYGASRQLTASAGPASSNSSAAAASRRVIRRPLVLALLARNGVMKLPRSTRLHQGIAIASPVRTEAAR